jgi:uncharacterized NAD(P)/FAD-binding protein YdhS
MQSQKLVIGVVGGGSIAVSYARQLTQLAIEHKIARQIEVVVFEPRAVIGAGAAYEADLASNLLNTRADSMSVMYGDKRHFLTWLLGNEHQWRSAYPDATIKPESFLPRELFGRYLESIHAETLRIARQNSLEIRHIRDEVVDLVATHHGITVVTSSRDEHAVNYIALCAGNLPANNFDFLVGQPGYFNSPYPCAALAESIDKQSTVGIIGTNLSAIDAALALSAAGHKGKIVCASRNGRLPSVRGHLNDGHVLRYLTRERIDALATYSGGRVPLATIAQLLMKEMADKTGKPFDVTAILNEEAGVYDYLDTEIAESNNHNRPWQSVIYSLNSVIDLIWDKLPLEDKITFHERFRSQWMSYRVSFPVQNAMRLMDMMRRDAMQVVGGLKSVSYDEDRKLFCLSAEDRRWRLPMSFEVERLINATGYSLDVAKSSVPLIRNMLCRRIATPNPFAGFNVDFDTGNLITGTGSREERVYVQGSLATGTYFWTNAMDVNVRIAYRQAQHLVLEMSRRLSDPNEKRPHDNRLFGSVSVAGQTATHHANV